MTSGQTPRGAPILVKAVVWLLTLGAMGVLVIPIFNRPLAAMSCPACFGFEKLDDGLYVERSMPEKQRRVLEGVLAAAAARVRDFYGRQEYKPTVMACAKQSCFDRLGGGGATVGSMGSSLMMVAPDGIGAVPLSHQLSNMELYGRVGFWRMLTGAIPAWFDEGVAVLASDDRNYTLAPRPGADQCLVDPGEHLPAGRNDWNGALTEDAALYARAACKVDRWMLKNGGSRAVPRLLARVASGEAFDAALK